jgi:hypothetical protein
LQPIDAYKLTGRAGQGPIDRYAEGKFCHPDRGASPKRPAASVGFREVQVNRALHRRRARSQVKSQWRRPVDKMKTLAARRGSVAMRSARH